MDLFNQLPEEKKHRIIQAALAEFAGKGYQAASTNEIARQAAISKGSLFHYFGSKEKLYRWLLTWAAEILEQALHDSRPLDGEDLVESLTRDALIRLKLFRQYPGLKGFVSKARTERKASDDFRAGLTSGYLGRRGRHATARVDQGPFRSDLSLEEAIRTAGWILDGMTREYSETNQPLDEADAEELTEWMLTLLKKLLYKEEYR